MLAPSGLSGLFPFRGSRGRLPQAAVLVAFLVVTLVVSLALAYQAVQATRAQRRAAEAVLRDYASIAAWEYARLTRDNLRSVFNTAFGDVPRRIRSSPPSPIVVAQETDDAMRAQRCQCRGLRDPRLVFRVDLATGDVTSLPEVPSARLQRLAELIAARVRAMPAQRYGLVMVEPGDVFGARTAVAYSVSIARDDTPVTVFGFAADNEAWGELLEHWYENRLLLPPVIARGQPNDSLLRVTVHAPAGQPVFESPIPYPATFAARDTLGLAYGSLTIEAALRPDAAADLVIGGLPRSRLPLLFGLLILTLGLGTAALLQIRREHELARMRDDFVSSVSHELRTPLAQIRVFAELLDEGRLRSDLERKRATGVISREARRLTHLLENILHFSKLRRSPADLAPEEQVDVGAVLTELVEAFQPLASARNATLELKVAPALAVLANRNAINQMVLNLLDNAVKYGPEGQTVRVGSVRRRDTIEISVQDEGPGIPAADRKRIWEAYQRLERDVSTGVPGSGIGLSVVTDFATLLGGEARVEDVAGGGARFIIELPAAPGHGRVGVSEVAEETVPA